MPRARGHSGAAFARCSRDGGRAYGGVREIPVDRIVGSAAPEAKRGDFDPGFLPTNRRMRERWTRIYQAMVEGDELPPIDVYRVDGNYYVIDGHHRVSVARNLGRPVINARVIDVKTRAPLGADVDPGTLLRAAEYAAFLDTTQLHRTRPEARLECSRLGRYEEILHPILGHAYFLSLERTRRWRALSAEGEPSGPDPAIEALLQEHARRWWRRRRKIELTPP